MKRILSSLVFSNDRGYHIVACAIVCVGLVVIGYSCVTVSVKVSPFARTTLNLSENPGEESSNLPVLVFDKNVRRICVTFSGELDEGFTELFDVDERVHFVFTWYHEGQLIISHQEHFPILSDMSVVANDCLTQEEFSLLKGSYQVVVMFGDVKVGDQEFQVE